MKKEENSKNFKSSDNTDNIIKTSIYGLVQKYSPGPLEEIFVTVINGYVNLSGLVQWMYQKTILVLMIRNIEGVRGITNNIGVANELFSPHHPC
ncbi:MAG TPA: BON domain-containing protein [Bacteroidia bacterium]|jgi:osmotically-inducible protein OsmY|nr:BON domain-containing protein [Bacteroidia bacterium]